MRMQEVKKVYPSFREISRICKKLCHNPEPSFLSHFFLFMAFETGPPAAAQHWCIRVDAGLISPAYVIKVY
jgi:hypothetical protein